VDGALVGAGSLWPFFLGIKELVFMVLKSVPIGTNQSQMLQDFDYNSLLG
jgi:hypothetical protein